MRAECIPHGYGIYSARIRNRFRTVAGKMVIISSFPIPVVFLKIVHTGSCIPVIVYTGYLLFLKVYTLRVLYS